MYDIYCIYIIYTQIYAYTRRCMYIHTYQMHAHIFMYIIDNKSSKSVNYKAVAIGF